MTRAIVKNRNGDVVLGPMSFMEEQDFSKFVEDHKEVYARYGRIISQLPPSPLSSAQQAHLQLLQGLATQANGILRHFVVDRDMARRVGNLKPTKADVRLAADALREAAKLLEELSAKEFGL